MTGPISVSSIQGSPIHSSSIAPNNISSSLSATSFCTYNMRRAEHRWPALWNDDASTSRTTCSGNADESTIIALSPPVSAISGASAARCRAILRLIHCAVLVEPVKQTPPIRESEVNAAPTLAPGPGNNWMTDAGIPASSINSTARAAIRLVCSAGLAITLLPAAIAARIWPLKIANGKFHGDIQTIIPRAIPIASTRSASLA